MSWRRSTDADTVSIEVVTVSGRAAGVDFRVHPTTVEVECAGYVAAFDRSHLGGWLANPHAAIRVGEVSFSLDRLVDRDGRVAISLPGVAAWTLSPHEVDCLRRYVG